MKKQPSWGQTAALCALSGATCAIIAFAAGGRLIPGYTAHRALITKLGEISDFVGDRYIGETDEAALNDWAAAAYVAALGDPYSQYIPAASTEEYQDNKYGATYGVGLQCIWLEEEQAACIYEVLDGSSAAENGLRRGDRIVGAEGKQAADIGFEALIDTIRGEVGTEVEVLLLRDGEELTVTLERRKLTQLMARGELLEDGVGFIRIFNFHQGSYDQFKAAYDALKQQGMERLVIDVRRNGGGLIDEMSRVADLFLPEGDVIITRWKSGYEEHRTSDAAMDALPLAVLVDEESYSAAEFLAAVMQETERAVVVGAQTTGKERAQNVYTLRDGSAVVLSDQIYCTPAGRTLGESGMTPDILAEGPSHRDFYLHDREGDAQLAAALEALRRGER